MALTESALMNKKNIVIFYLGISCTGGSISLSYKQAAIYAACERYGFFTLISNEVRDPVIASFYILLSLIVTRIMLDDYILRSRGHGAVVICLSTDKTCLRIFSPVFATA